MDNLSDEQTKIMMEVLNALYDFLFFTLELLGYFRIDLSSSHMSSCQHEV
jgi:hypothetical protein